MELYIKKRGETLGDMMLRARKELCIPVDMKATYAGRLDPMAEGIVPILYGEDVYRKEYFMGHDKTYEVEILFGVSTDTGDVSGIHEDKEEKILLGSREEVKRVIENFRGEHFWNYPRYSSKPIHGKPLFQETKDSHIKKEDTPKRLMNIKTIKFVNMYKKNKHELINGIINDIKKVNGEFRQNEIIHGWKSYKEVCSSDESFDIIMLRTNVASGTYMRVLAEKIGEVFGVPALALTIKRTNIDF